MTEVLKTDKLGINKTLTLMVGLPYSGKSTEAKTLGAPIVNPDSIRVALHGKKFVPSAEPYVWAIAKTMVKALFLSGHDRVILDATNTSDVRRNDWVTKDWTTNCVCVDTPAITCIMRAKDAGDHIMIPIIEDMATKLEWPEEYCK